MNDDFNAHIGRAEGAGGGGGAEGHGLSHLDCKWKYIGTAEQNAKIP